jgi:acetoin utilization protein AcuC
MARRSVGKPVSGRPVSGRPIKGKTVNGPLLVFGPRSLEYDFGPYHPLSPRRFGPGIELLRAVGAQPGLAPEPASDEELEWLHAPEYLAAVKRFSADPSAEPAAGIGPGDDPPFRGMHEAAAVVAGGSIRAMEAILRGQVEHAYQPGGGLHHAARSRASGFCIYNDVALAIARARHEGLRALYVDLDVHHGDGVQALHYADPGVLTVSFHESGRSLFPGSGFLDELGEGSAAGTSVNVPLEPLAGPDAWLAAVRAIVPALAASFGPDVIVSQHGADGHAWDPLAHLALTTTAMGEAARLVDRLAHRYAGGRWLATGGGGYAVYRVVPRAWALTWLAGAHREPPEALPEAWRSRWESEAAGWGEAPLPGRFEDEPSVALDRPISREAAEKAGRTVELVRTLTVPGLLRAADLHGWWRFEEGATSLAAPAARAEAPGAGGATIRPLDPDMLGRLRLAPRVIALADPAEGMALLRAAVAGGATGVAAVAGEWLVGLALAAPLRTPIDWLLALGVAPEWRRGGLAGALLPALVEEEDGRGRIMAALHTAAERDPVDPLPRAVRRSVAERLLDRAGFQQLTPPAALSEADPDARLAIRPAQPTRSDLRPRLEDWFSRP